MRYAGGICKMNLPPLLSRQCSCKAWTPEPLTFERLIALMFALESSIVITYNSHLNSISMDYTSGKLTHHQILCPSLLSGFCTIFSYLSGIVSKLEIYYPHVHMNRWSQLVAHTLKGCKWWLLQPIMWKLPLSCTDIQQVIIMTTSTISYNNSLFAAMLATGFETLQHLGELTWPDNKAISLTNMCPCDIGP